MHRNHLKFRLSVKYKSLFATVHNQISRDTCDEQANSNDENVKIVNEASLHCKHIEQFELPSTNS